ncbi:hypothetical protein [Nocardia sp. CA-290969]|uniref:hypothetical protein n=1 Tax=Nocardia sp. CA-290969 TaxID=3239986 RepID=UPI003D8FF580
MKTGDFATDPRTKEDVKHRATIEETSQYQVLNPAAREELDKKSEAAIEAHAERTGTASDLNHLMPEFGVEKHSEINSPAKLTKLMELRIEEIARDSSLNGTQKRERLERLNEFESLATRYNEQLNQAKALSKEMGEIGAIAHALDPIARPGAILLAPFDGLIDGSKCIDGRDTIDVISFLPARESGPGLPGRPPTLVLNEAKGGGSPLKDADTPDGRAEQGSPEYLRRTLAIDLNLQRLLHETPTSMLERGLDPNSPKGRAYLQARAELLRAFSDGTLRYEYNKIQVTRDGTVTESRFTLERNGKLLPMDVFGRTDRELTRELLRNDRTYLHSQELTQDNAQKLSDLLEPLGRYDREIVGITLQHTDDAWLSNARSVQAMLEGEQARQALDRVSEALAQGGSLSEISKLLASAKKNIAAAIEIETEIRKTAARELDVGDLSQIVERNIELVADGRNQEVLVAVRVLEQDFIEHATQRILQSTSERDNFSRFVQEMTTDARALEKDRSDGRTPDLTELLREVESIDRAILAERDFNSRELTQLELEPDHQRLIAQVLDSDCRDLESAREVFERHIIAQAAAKASEARASDAQDRAQFLTYALDHSQEIANTLARGVEPDPDLVRQLGDQIQRAIEHERAIETQALEALGISAEQAEYAARVLDIQRARDYEQAQELVVREQARTAHNELVGPTKGLQISAGQAHTLDPVAYEMVRYNEPIARDGQALIYQQAGREPIAIPHDSPSRRYAEIAKLISRGVPPELALNRYLVDISQSRDPAEAVRRLPTANELQVKRAKDAQALERARQQGLGRGLGDGR